MNQSRNYLLLKSPLPTFNVTSDTKSDTNSLTQQFVQKNTRTMSSKMTSLPPQEEAQFNQVLKYWEMKNYKKGLKIVDRLLQKHPKSGECLCVKGLLLHSMGKREEGEAVAKKGLPLSLTRSISWRVFGLIAQNERRYADTAASFIRASKFDPENLTILRDLAFIQAHIRDYTGLLQTRKNLVLKKPDNLLWMSGYAVALYLNNLHGQAAQVTDAYLNAMEDDPKNPSESRYQRGEMALFKVRCLEADGQYGKVLKYLESAKNIIVDPIGYLESKGRCQLKLNKLDEAKETYLRLLEYNSNNYAYLSGIQEAHGFPSEVEPEPQDFLPEGKLGDEEITNGLTKLYDELTEKFPKSLTIPRIALNFAQKEYFRVRLEKYITPYLLKTIPSLYSTLKKLYVFEDKVKIIEEVFLAYEKSLGETNKFPSSEKAEPEAPSTYLWVLLYLSFHFDKLGETERALDYIERAITHTPTMLELYLCKGKIYKHAGNPNLAFEAVDEARQFDLADRFLNTLAARYALRADLIDEAVEIATIFATQNLEKKMNLDEMQCIWYEIERGESFLRQGEYSEALREFFFIDKNFYDMYDDQFDFHGYSLRKVTINAYIDMVKYFDRFWNHPWYVRAALGVIDAYIDIFDKELHKLPLTEEIIKYNEQHEREHQKKPAFEIPPNGEMLMRSENPLGMALPFLRKLEQFSPSNPKTYERAIELNLRRNKPLQVLKSIKLLHNIDAENSYIYTGIIRLCKHSTFPEAIVKEIIMEELVQFGVDANSIDASLENLVDHYKQRNMNTLIGRLGIIRLDSLLSGRPNFSIMEEDSMVQSSNIELLRYIYNELKKLHATNLESFASKIKSKNKWTNYFD